MTVELKVGETVQVGWNGAKYILGDSDLAHTQVRIEAVGFDWVVARDPEGYACCGTYNSGRSLREQLEE